MADRDVGHLERAAVDHGRIRFNHGDDVVGVALFLQLAPRDVRGEFTRIDRRAQLFPQQANRADVVFVGVGDENTLDLRPAFFQPGDIGENQINAGRTIHVGKGDAQIDDDQTLFAFGAIAVDVAVHADFTGAAKRHIDQSVVCFCSTHVRSLLY